MVQLKGNNHDKKATGEKKDTPEKLTCFSCLYEAFLSCISPSSEERTSTGNGGHLSKMPQQTLSTKKVTSGKSAHPASVANPSSTGQSRTQADSLVGVSNCKKSSCSGVLSSEVNNYKTEGFEIGQSIPDIGPPIKM